MQMAQLTDLPRPDSPILDLLEDPFYALDLPSLMACLEPLPQPDGPISPSKPPLPLVQVSAKRLCMTMKKFRCM